MDPNTLNLKSSQPLSSQGGIPSVQAGSITMGQQTPNQSQAPVIDETVLDDIQKELRTRFELLPKEIQDTIVSSGFQSTLFELGKKYKISYAELGQLELETTTVLLGMTRPEDFESELADAIKKDRMTVIAPLVKEIDTLVFSPIRQHLVALYEEERSTRDPGSEASVPLAQELVSKPPLTMAPDAVGGISFPKTTTVPIQTVVTQPRAASATQPQTLEKHEDDMLKDSGIEIGTAPFHTETTAKDSFTSKLTGVFGVKSTTTDHTLPKIGESGVPIQGGATPAKGVDPYREQL